jgi:hypothetical protein
MIMNFDSRLQRIENKLQLNKHQIRESIISLDSTDHQALNNPTLPAEERTIILQRYGLKSWPLPQPCKVYLNVNLEMI